MEKATTNIRGRGAPEREGEDMGGSNAVDPQGGPKRRTRRNVNQNLGCVYCWATDAETGQPCTSRSAEGSNLPYCERHRRIGDGAIQVLDHPENHAVGKIVVANIDLPKGYKFVYWGKRCRWRGCKGEDRAMSFRPNGGVIDPTGCEGQQVQFMACPGPSERSNIKCTDVCFGKTYDTSLVGREIETSEPVKKNHQLLQWYGSKEWFESRGIPRTNVGTEAHPAPQRKKKLKSATEGGRKRKAKGQLKPEVGTSGQEHVKPEEDVMVQLTPKGLLVASDLLEVGGRPFEVGRPQPKQGSLFFVSPHQPFSPPSQLTPSFSLSAGGGGIRAASTRFTGWTGRGGLRSVRPSPTLAVRRRSWRSQPSSAPWVWTSTRRRASPRRLSRRR